MLTRHGWIRMLNWLVPPLCLHWRKEGSTAMEFGWVCLELASFPSQHHCRVESLRRAKGVWLLQLLLLCKSEHSLFSSCIFVSLGFRDLFSVVSLDYSLAHCSLSVLEQQQHWAVAPGAAPGAVTAAPLRPSRHRQHFHNWLRTRAAGSSFCCECRARISADRFEMQILKGIAPVCFIWLVIYTVGKAEQLRLETRALPP